MQDSGGEGTNHKPNKRALNNTKQINDKNVDTVLSIRARCHERKKSMKTHLSIGVPGEKDE